MSEFWKKPRRYDVYGRHIGPGVSGAKLEGVADAALIHALLVAAYKVMREAKPGTPIERRDRFIRWAAKVAEEHERLKGPKH